MPTLSRLRERRTNPLFGAVARSVRQDLNPTDILFPSRRGGRLSTDAVQFLVTKYAAAAGTTCPSIATKKVTPHVLRHTMAMLLPPGLHPRYRRCVRSLYRDGSATFLGEESVHSKRHLGGPEG